MRQGGCCTDDEGRRFYRCARSTTSANVSAGALALTGKGQNHLGALYALDARLG